MMIGGPVKLQNFTLYLVDGGACYCGKHCGHTARCTGRDYSGARVIKVTPKIAAGLPVLRCERCGLGASSVGLIVDATLADGSVQAIPAEDLECGTRYRVRGSKWEDTARCAEHASNGGTCEA